MSVLPTTRKLRPLPLIRTRLKSGSVNSVPTLTAGVRNACDLKHFACGVPPL
jgi:hypothetical protein